MGAPNSKLPALRVDRLSVVSGRSSILSEVTLDLAPGQRLAVVGRSGAGKTTLLNAIAGLTPIATGSIQVGQRVCASDGKQRLAPDKRGVGFVFQDLGLWDHLNVAETLAFAAEGDRKQRKARAAELAEQVGLAKREDAFPQELSGGEQQRLALARALAGNPQLLLLDEPFAHLDPPLRRSLGELVLDRVARAELSLIVVSHSLDDVLRLGDRLCVLEGGTCVESGTVETNLSTPRSRALVELFDLGSVVAGSVSCGVFRCALGELPLDGPDGPALCSVPPETVIAQEGGVPATVLGTTPSRGHPVRELRTEDRQRLLTRVEARPGTTLRVGLAGSVTRLDR